MYWKRRLVIYIIIIGVLILGMFYFFGIIELSTSKGVIMSLSEASFQQLPDKFKGKRLPFHQIYEPRKIGFMNYPIKSLNGFEARKKKTILLWTPWNSQWNTINYYSLQSGNISFTRVGCRNTNCVVTTDSKYLDKADFVLFHLLDINYAHMPQVHRPNQVWILYIMEAPWLVRGDLTSLSDIFNWTMSYREDSDVLVKYGFVGQKESKDNHTDVDSVFPQKTKSVVWFVSDCHTDSRRESYAKELAKYIDVDIYGTCGNKTCFPAQSSVCYDDILKYYKFYLSFENSLCKDYVTEKFFNILNYNIVPVVFGSVNYSFIAPDNSFIDATKFPNPRDLANYLNFVGNNKTLYDSFLKWKGHYESYLYPWPCHLCDKMHEPVTPSILKDVEKWWISDAKCQRWQNNKGFYYL